MYHGRNWHGRQKKNYGVAQPRVWWPRVGISAPQFQITGYISTLLINFLGMEILVRLEISKVCTVWGKVELDDMVVGAEIEKHLCTIRAVSVKQEKSPFRNSSF